MKNVHACMMNVLLIVSISLGYKESLIEILPLTFCKKKQVSVIASVNMFDFAAIIFR